MWRHAGIERTREGLEVLTLEPFPLAGLVAAAGLARRESRGAHRRGDAPGADPALDGHHTVVSAAEAMALERWD
jgi:succinate dehydrogenase/fumarate reductase flavoprotein subunit